MYLPTTNLMNIIIVNIFHDKMAHNASFLQLFFIAAKLSQRETKEMLHKKVWHLISHANLFLLKANLVNA